MANLPYTTQELIWMGDSLDKLSGFPIKVKTEIGFLLRQAQNGRTPGKAKPLPEIGRSVFELPASFDTDTYRTVYVTKLRKGVYVLDAFMKKSKKGKAIPKPDKERLKKRLADATAYDKR